jgi:hypothetical protein
VVDAVADDAGNFGVGDEVGGFRATSPPPTGTSRSNHAARDGSESLRQPFEVMWAFRIRLAIPPSTKGDGVARKTIFVSDLTGKTIDDRDAATVTIRYADARRGQVVLDVNASEVADLAAKGRKQARRGRKPKS